MRPKTDLHSFHIPVMGLAYTVDSPIKIAKYGISSVISIVDDFLIEKMNEYYSEKYKLPFQAISTKVDDYRAKRITSYLNTVDTIVKSTFEKLKSSFNEKNGEFEKYMDMLPDFSELKQQFKKAIHENSLRTDVNKWIQDHLKIGSIDVNIMTKLDKVNYKKNVQLSNEFNDAHAALRGFANSNLESSIVLSAGMNPRLYSYFEKFEDFFPDANMHLKKKIILKVSDYRSAIIQGKFLAKKGLWVSEFRIESGLNCGGHAFASDGYLLGPILEEFKIHKQALIEDINSLYVNALSSKGRFVPDAPLEMNITVQGGVGTADEHEFLLDNYEVDSVGWGTPFLLVPEATTVDPRTIDALKESEEKDLYLSNISPLGVPFNSLRGTTNEILKQQRIDNNKAGSSCPKKFLVSNKEYSEKAICTASKKYQKIKLKELEAEENRSEISNNHITDKTCLCEGLANAAYERYDIENKVEDQGVAVCPGPNMAYFSKELSLSEMISHIYGKIDVITSLNRPNMFIKELKLYLDYFNSQIQNVTDVITVKQQKYFNNFYNNLQNGISYYEQLFSNFETNKEHLLAELGLLKKELFGIKLPVLQLA